jgi:hypothetical protein
MEEKRESCAGDIATSKRINKFNVQLGTLGRELERKSLEQPNNNQFNKKDWAR